MPKKDNRVRQNYSFELPQEDRERYQAIADKLGWSLSQWIRESLEISADRDEPIVQSIEDRKAKRIEVSSVFIGFPCVLVAEHKASART